MKKETNVLECEGKRIPPQKTNKKGRRLEMDKKRRRETLQRARLVKVNIFHSFEA